jgi:argininosuccinate lyase
MPQKKNPDTLELTRGKASTIIGRLTGMLTLIKGLPSAYDKDLQEDKVPLFETFDTLNLMLPVVAGVLNTLTIKKERLAQSLDPNLLATDLADYLVQKGVPFRDAHGVIGTAVRRAAELGLPLDQLSLSEMQSIHPAFESDMKAVFDFQAAVARREVPGATGPKAVQIQLQQAKSLLA